MEYNHIKVKLNSGEGVVKYSTEVAPSGYYFLPTSKEDIGRSFFLAVEGPTGWNFEPTQAKVFIGQSGVCQRADANDKPIEGDINFYFTGFSISGQVVGEDCGSNEKISGPEGITIQLQVLDSSNSYKLVGSTHTNDKGSYTFSNIFPGNYHLLASHPTWLLSKKEANITIVEWGNFKVSTDFIVSGYDIKGSIMTSVKNSRREPVMGVDVILYLDNSKVSSKIDSNTCGNIPQLPKELHNEKKAVCASRTNEEGKYTFHNIPCGQYTLVPIYRTSSSFDISPSSRSIEITGGSLSIEEPFVVLGFSISGKVVDGKGNGLKGVVIKVNDIQKAITDDTGIYKLEQLSSGQYNIEASKEHYKFNNLIGHNINPNNAILPQITVKEYEVCGKVIVTNPSTQIERTISISSDKGTKEISTKKDGKFCFFAEPGKYTLVPIISNQEKSSGFTLNPSTLELQVSDSPIFNVLFVQTRVSISGKVKCIQSCISQGIEFQLRTKEGAGVVIKSNGLIRDSPDSFEFLEVLPGNYEVTIGIPHKVAQHQWCWDKTSIDIVVKTDNITDLQFTQTGYSVSMYSDVPVQTEFRQKDKIVQVFDLTGGSFEGCLKKSGVYTVTTKSCYTFGEEHKYDTNRYDTLKFSALRTQVHGSIEVVGDIPSKDIHLKLSKSSGDSVLNVTKSKEGNKYEYSFFAKRSEEFTLTPKVESIHNLLFYPRFTNNVISSFECPQSLPTFTARAGIFLKGSVDPKVSGVEITASFAETNEQFAQIFTDNSGTYNIGPLYDDQQYKVTAFKEDYVFEEKSKGNFKAIQLGRISVIVKESGTSNSLLQSNSKVLLSLSGENYRSNNVTHPNGTLIFHSLYPDTYFLKPMLKEYSFNPSSSSVTVSEGTDAKVEFTATRVAYSCYGNVVALNGEPEQFVTVQAVNVDNEGDKEETQADSNGSFRIRGLTPNKSYRVTVKGTNTDNVERATPDYSIITVGSTDVKGIQFIVFRKPSKLDISGTVNVNLNNLVTNQSALKLNDWISSISITLRSNDGSIPDKTIQLGPSTNNYFEFSSLPKGKYIVKMQPNLPRNIQRNFANVKPIEQSVVVDNGNVHVEFDLSPVLSSETQDQSGGTSIGFVLILFGLVIFAIFNPKTALSIVQSIREGKWKKQQTQQPENDNPWISDRLKQQKRK